MPVYGIDRDDDPVGFDLFFCISLFLDSVVHCFLCYSLHDERIFLIFVKEINTSILLFSSGNEVMAIVLFQLLEEQSASVVAAYAVILTSILLLVVSVIRGVVGLEKIR